MQRIEQLKIGILYFQRFFHTFFFKNPYKLESHLATISTFIKILKKFMYCCFMMRNDKFNVLSDLKTFRFFWDTLLPILEQATVFFLVPFLKACVCSCKGDLMDKSCSREVDKNDGKKY